MKDSILKHREDFNSLVEQAMSATEYSHMRPVKEPEYRDIKVDKWRISVTTSPERKDLPKQKIKIEVSNVPAYTKLPLALRVNYEFLPDGYGDTLIMTESLDEIMADKLISLVNTTRYVRNQDIWDLRWLKQKGASINFEFIQSKIKDYKIKNYVTKLDAVLNRIDAIINGKDFYDEMSRFLPSDIQERTLRKEKFKHFLVIEIKKTLSELRKFFS